jgi:hypothetical protein
MQKTVDKNLLFYFINVAFLIPTTSPHYFCIRLGNQGYSRSQLPTKMEKLKDWTKQPKTSCVLFFTFDYNSTDLYYSLSSERLVDIKITKFYVEKVIGT